MKTIRSSLPSSSWLVATVVPWLTAVTALPSRPSWPRTFCTPARKPSAGSAGGRGGVVVGGPRAASAGSAGVDGVLVVATAPVSSSTATTSVNVPPVSIPMRTRRALMSRNLSAEIPAPEDRAGRPPTEDPPSVDITEIILEQHHQQRRMFAVLDEMPRGDNEALGAMWD